MIDILLAHSRARRTGKPPFFFSKFTFQKMKEVGNTHFCFDCGGRNGFTPDPNGEVAKSIDDDGYDPMKRHDFKTHTAVVGNADKYTDPWDWLEKEVPKDFPYTLSIPRV